MAIAGALSVTRSYKPDYTLGVASFSKGIIHTLEPPWKGNLPNVSCIPPGIYLAKWMERSGSGKYKRVWHIQDVPRRTGILIHAGNYPSHTWGCILPGTRAIPGGVGESQKALNLLREEWEGQDFLIRLCST